jgi:N-acetylglucosamine-6-sulfatase
MNVVRGIVLLALGVLSLIGSGGPEGAINATAAIQPNIIFILTDDMRADDLVGMPYSQDALIGAGTTFGNAFVTTPICCPSRASALRGQYTHNHGIWSNKPRFLGEPSSFPRFYADGEEASTVATWLHDAGYRTALVGKYLSHFTDAVPPEYVPPGWDEFTPQARGRYYGFHLIEDGAVVKYSRKSGAYSTDVFTDKAVDFVRRAGQGDQPFFLYLAPLAPHDTAVAAARHADAFPDVAAPRGPAFNEADVNDKPRRIQNLPVMNDDVIAKMDTVYRARLQTLLAVDEMVATLDQALAETGALDNTYIVFTSDNGYFLGEHRFPDGKGGPYDEAIKVPFVVRGPGVAAGRVDARLVTIADVAPTFADLAGTQPAPFVDGRSLVPLLHGDETVPWRASLLVEYRWPATGTFAWDTLVPWDNLQPAPAPVPRRAPADADSAGAEDADAADDAEEELVPPFRVLVTSEMRYVEHQDGAIELYDVASDPAEIENIAAQTPAAELDRLSAALNRLVGCAAASCRVAEDAVLD